MATRADCTRRKVGAVILDTELRVVSTGYNGSYPGGPSCLAGDCPRGRHYRTNEYYSYASRCRIHTLIPSRSIACDKCKPAFACACGGYWPCGAADSANPHAGRHYNSALMAADCITCNGPHCACGRDWPCPEAVGPGSSYDTGPGACIAVHAEANAILFADRHRLPGAVLYLTHEPCDGCMKLIRNTRISAVIWQDGRWEVEE